MHTNILTYSKQSINPLAPEPAQINLADIAHALSLLCRGNGHIHHFYSVAQHSLNCALEAKKRQLSPRLILILLLHDASEAYLSDVTRPVKCHLPDYLKLEAQLQATIWQAFHIGQPTPAELEILGDIDDALLQKEMAVLMDSPPKKPLRPLRTEPNLRPVPPREIEAAFLQLAQSCQKTIQSTPRIIPT